MHGFLSDLRFASRQMKQNRLLSFVFVTLLAVGIGTNTMIFSFINTLLLNPLPVRGGWNQAVWYPGFR